jgi:SAM-dependent methyltransferase
MAGKHQMTNSSEMLRETDIRPDHLMEGQSARFLADIARLLERRNEFIEVPCPSCERDDAPVVFTKYELTYRRCPACDTMYVSPRPSPAVLESYYATSENYAYWAAHIFPASEDVRRERIFRPRVAQLLEICRRFGVRPGTLLEVGAGFGTFCEELEKAKFFGRIVAVEPTPDLAERCRSRGIDVIQAPIEQISPNEVRADVVVCFEVLEHLFSPQDYIRQCARMLNPGGLLLITCPNGQGFDVSVLGAVSDTVDVEHLNYFNPDSLTRLARSCGMEVLEVTTPGMLDAELVRKKVLSGAIDLSEQEFLRRVLIDRWESVGVAFQQFLAANALSSHMWLAARKP